MLEYKKFTDKVSDSTLQLISKKLIEIGVVSKNSPNNIKSY